MAKDKYDFIQDLLTNKRLTPSQKERVLTLTKEEIKKDSDGNEELKKRVFKIEKLLEDLRLNQKEGTISKTKKETSSIVSPPKDDEKIYYIKPDNTVKFLTALNSNYYTKFLTHNIDSTDILELRERFDGQYNYGIHLNKISQVFNVLTVTDSDFKQDFPDLKKLTISKNLFTKISNYINGGTWGEKENIMNWSHHNLIEWCNENPDKTPSPGNDLGYEGFRYGEKTFTDLILDFKNEIHIRNVNPLSRIVQKILYEPANDFKSKMDIVTNFDDSIDFFTDVEKLKQIIRSILSLVLEKHESNKEKANPLVDFSLKSTNGRINLLILNKKKSIHANVETFRIGKSTKQIMKQCNGVCDLEIFGNFMDGIFYKFPVWTVGRKIEFDKVYQNNKELIVRDSIKKSSEQADGILFKLTF